MPMNDDLFVGVPKETERFAAQRKRLAAPVQSTVRLVEFGRYRGGYDELLSCFAMMIRRRRRLYYSRP